jgi:hypothetical protein
MSMPARAQADKKNAADSSEVHRLFIADQADRDNTGPNGTATPDDWKRITARDRQRQERTHQLIAAGELKSADNYYDAAFIFQHGSGPDDFLLAHVLASVAVAKGNADARWIAAATLDRYLHSIKRGQIFGTQYDRDDNNPWTQEPYDRELVPDALRTVFGVPLLTEQQKTLDETYNKSRPATAQGKQP